MQGTIIKVYENADSRFSGRIETLTEEGKAREYPFNGGNWLDRGLQLAELEAAIGAAVEFELSRPTASGMQYPTNIRFAGQSVEDFWPLDLAELVSVNTVALQRLLPSLQAGYQKQPPYQEFNGFRKAYALLQNDDFEQLQEADVPVLRFPSGLVADSGAPILLYCVPNMEREKNPQPWYCNRLYCDGRVIGGMRRPAAGPAPQSVAAAPQVVDVVQQTAEPASQSAAAALQTAESAPQSVAAAPQVVDVVQQTAEPALQSAAAALQTAGAAVGVTGRAATLQGYVYVMTSVLQAQLASLCSGYRKTSIQNDFRAFSETYNTLSDADFQLSVENGVEVLRFPTGFTADDGQPILFYCVRNLREGVQPWHCTRLVCGDRVLGNGAPVAAENKHTRGSFRDFLYVQTRSLIPLLCTLSSACTFDQKDPEDVTACFHGLENHFNTLTDEDFVELEGEDGPVLQFPSGFAADDGTPVLLHCVPNHKERPRWYCDRLSCRGSTVSAVFSVVKVSWFELEDDLAELLPEFMDSGTQIVHHINGRCGSFESAAIWLKDGRSCDSGEAEELFLPTGYFEAGGKEIHLRCTLRSGSHGYGWYYDCCTYEDAPLDHSSKKFWIKMWGDMECTDEQMKKLADMAMEEPWNFEGRPEYEILRNYLRYTFARQWQQGAVCRSRDGRYAAFNTGLPERTTYRYIYAFFEKTPTPEGVHPLHHVPKYRFAEFVLRGKNGNSKKLSVEFDQLPQPPQYFASRSKMVWELEYNDNNDVTIPQCSEDHILIQRCERLPLGFFRRAAWCSPRLQEILASAKEDAEKYEDIRDLLRPVMESEPDEEVRELYSALIDQLENVIKKALKRLSFNWRAVVPCFNPEKNAGCFLLPVSFEGNIDPDCALVATMNEEGYVEHIHTVLTLDMAYLDARLVCRPESEWLVASRIN